MHGIYLFHKNLTNFIVILLLFIKFDQYSILIIFHSKLLYTKSVFYLNIHDDELPFFIMTPRIICLCVQIIVSGEPLWGRVSLSHPSHGARTVLPLHAPL